MEFSEQVTLFANARLISGIEGSNMFNLAFQKRMRKCFIIVSPNLIHFSSSFLQAGYVSKTSMYIGDCDTKGVHDSWDVDTVDLEKCVDAWIAD